MHDGCEMGKSHPTPQPGTTSLSLTYYPKQGKTWDDYAIIKHFEFFVEAVASLGLAVSVSQSVIKSGSHVLVKLGKLKVMLVMYNAVPVFSIHM